MSDGLQSFLDSGTSFEGKVAFTGAVRIDGSFRGDAASDGTLIIGETGSVEADLEVDTLIVQGAFNGSVSAKTRVEIGANARVEGHVATPRLLVAEGAHVAAEIRMGAR